MESLFDKYFNEVKSIVLLPIEFDENGLKNPQKVIGLSIFRLFKLFKLGLYNILKYFPFTTYVVWIF
jgi:hypothetical protein